MKYHIITFGCQMNLSDSERMARLLKRAGGKESSLAEADLVLVNMCSVRQSAVDRVLGLREKLKGKKTVLAGCVLDKDKKNFDFFDKILPVKSLGHYLKIIPLYESKFSAVVPIMTGCNNFCSYCVVPYTRGPEKCRESKDILREITSLVKKGYKEIWLLGQNVNSYKSFPQLLTAIDKISGNFWIRFTSSHPKDFSDKLIYAMKTLKKVTPYLNLPVQAGDNSVLKAMNRPYNIGQYKEAILKVRKEIPNITISTDIIVGFPGETKKQFQNSAKFFNEMGYDMAYISEYSKRAGTKASLLKETVSQEEKKKRKIMLNNILIKTAMQRNRKYVGKTVDVLISKKLKDNAYAGKTREYKDIKVSSSKNIIGKFVKAKVISASSFSLRGKLL
ncbi:MiaB/RimO family radical SAM methylthiotransferase [Patescibacteria group bacterium]|nr:MiaB/RimO family radical SAM methylthiotransferase [Patescibacteria group bacterium]